MRWPQAVLVCCFLCMPVVPAIAGPGYGEPLDITTGTIYRVGTVSQLQNAFTTINVAGVPATVLVSNGTYVLTDWALPVTCDDVIVRSLSGDRDAVVIRGPDEGTSASTEHIFWVQGNDFTVADITFGWCLYHGVQAHGQSPVDVSGLWVHNCRIVNCNEQFIKGTSAPADPEGVTDSLVENCLFEFTNTWAYQYYTGGIDVHKGANWIVRDNLFRGIRNPGSGIAEHAIHFWKRNTSQSQNIVAERNIIINCDRGIGFGLGAWADGHNGGNSVIRNNFVYNDGSGSNTDVGIGLESANDVLVDNNTVYVPYWAPIEYRFTSTVDIVFRNNLANGGITARDSAPAADESNNVENAQSSWFEELTNGNLHLVAGVTQAIDQGCTIVEFTNDIDGEVRSTWDIGADEYDMSLLDSDSDGIPDWWEIQYGLNHTNAADAFENEDEDEYDNLGEWAADTNPTNSESYLRMIQLSGLNRGLLVRWCGGQMATQYLEWAGDPGGTWNHARTYTPPTSVTNEYDYTGGTPNRAYLRVRCAR